MNIKSSICGIQHTCINFLIFLIITKIECWPLFKQDPPPRRLLVAVQCVLSNTLLLINMPPAALFTRNWLSFLDESYNWQLPSHLLYISWHRKYLNCLLHVMLIVIHFVDKIIC